MVEHLLAFLNFCRKIEYKDDALFNDLFSMLSSKRILAMFELGEIDLFSPAVIFLGSDPECSMKANNFFLSPVNLKDELKRKAYLTLICHPDGQHFLTSIKHCQQILIDLIKLRVLKSGSFERAAEIEPMTLDEFVFKILTKFAATFPNWFARNKKLAEFLRQFLLSDYFRGNYLLQDFCIGKNDRLRLTNFRLALANVPDLVTNLLINYFTYNPKKYEILLALCSLLPQMTFADNGSLKRFISNFIVPRTTLLWRRNLLKFAMSKFVTVFNNFPKPSDSEEIICRQNDCQLYLGNFFLYIVVPCFSYALERFRARQVFNCEYDKIIGKQKWKKHQLHASKNSTDLVVVFCQNVLRRFQQHFQNPQVEYGPPATIRPELSHGILQMAILLLQRASSHIHKPGSKKQSEHLQTMMQSAWGSLTQTGIYVDRWLRSVAYFLLSNVMNAFYIKRDIVYQLFDCLILLPDIRENPIAQKALDGIATHSARRRDECYQGLVDKIKEALTVDGFNVTKVGNVLFMLANNYEAFFPARGTLLPSVVFVLVRIQNSRQINVMNFIFDGLETIVGWEDLRTKKFNLIKDNLIRSANASQDPNLQRRIQNQIANLTRSPNFLAADRVLSDTISMLLCRIMANHPETERGKRFLAIFHKAIQPRLFCRVICLRFEKLLTIRDPSQGQQQIGAQIQPIINTLKILSSFLVSAAPDSIYHCLLYLQPVFAGSLKSQNINFMEAAVNFIAKLLEIIKELPVNEQKFGLLFQTLIQYFSWAGDNFIS
uniref:Uncharacterized protein n=1 Tax=Panagrolaimus davidi TaxID=227884 RepID=A0A914P9H0_9BILA